MARERRRKPLRLAGYDYAQPGAYFVTICVQGRVCLFGTVSDGEMYLSALGTDAAQCWQELPQHDPHITLDAFVVMPKHAHGIFVIQGNDSDIVGVGLTPAPTAPVEPKRQALPEGVRTFTTFSARRISPQRNAPSESVGQPGYYEHVARSERNLADSRAYIGSNPARWTVDDYFLADR